MFENLSWLELVIIGVVASVVLRLSLSRRRARS
jgi:hypothetical protein